MYMSKKFISLFVTLVSLFVFSVFSLTNALALEGDASGADGSAPLTSVKALCRQAKTNYKNDVSAAKAKGLSLQLSQEEIDQMVQEIKDYRKKVCTEAAGLTSAVKLCKEAKKNYSSEVKLLKAKGLSFQLTKKEIAKMIQEVKDYRKKVCTEAKNSKA